MGRSSAPEPRSGIRPAGPVWLKVARVVSDALDARHAAASRQGAHLDGARGSVRTPSWRDVERRSRSGCFAFKAGEEALFAGPCRLLDHAHHSEWQLQLANLYRELRQPGALQRAHRNN